MTIENQPQVRQGVRGPATRRISVMLTREQEAQAAKIGLGNVSLGIRLALRAWAEREEGK